MSKKKIISDSDDEIPQLPKNKRFKSDSKLWPAYLSLRPSFDTDTATAEEISSTDINFSMFTAAQIAGKIKYLKIQASKASGKPTSTNNTTDNNNDNSDNNEYQVNSDDDDDEDEDEEDNELNNKRNNKNNGGYRKLWFDDDDAKLIKLFKIHRSSFPSDTSLARKILKDNDLNRKDLNLVQVQGRISYLKNKHNLDVPLTPPPPLNKSHIQHTPPPSLLQPSLAPTSSPSSSLSSSSSSLNTREVFTLEFWSSFKSIRANYSSDSDAIKRLMEDEKYSKEYFVTLSNLVSRYKKKFGTSENWITIIRSGDTTHKNNYGLAQQPLLTATQDDKDNEKDNQIKELKEKLKKEKNENKGLKIQVGTLENKVINLNQVIKEKEEVLAQSKISNLNENTNISSTNSAAIIKLPTSNDDIYIIFPSFSGGNTTLKIVEIIDNKYHIEIKHENNTFTNISNHFIKVMPGYQYPTSCLIKHNGTDNNGIYLKKKI